MQEILESLQLPEVRRNLAGDYVQTRTQWEKRREELREILLSEEYGFLPGDMAMTVQMTEKLEKQFSGHTTWEKLAFSFANRGETHTVPVQMLYPNNTKLPVPFFVFVNFRPEIPDKYYWPEDIIEQGFGVISFYYKDVTDDSAAWDGLCKLHCAEADRTPHTCGKIAVWSYMAQRVMDYLQTRPEADKKNIAVLGHSRLGKTALLTGALDERFAFACVHNSGCCGAAISRGKGGESVASITERFPHWFCTHFHRYANNEAAMPFDQHFLLSLLAPRRVCVGASELDTWADTNFQFLNCIAASESFGFYDKVGFVCGDRYPRPGDFYADGNIAFFMRDGTHFLAMRDWRQYMRYIKNNLNTDDR